MLYVMHCNTAIMQYIMLSDTAVLHYLMFGYTAVKIACYTECTVILRRKVVMHCKDEARRISWLAVQRTQGNETVETVKTLRRCSNSICASTGRCLQHVMQCWYVTVQMGVFGPTPTGEESKILRCLQD